MYKTEREMQKSTLLKNGDYKTTREVFERIAKYIPDAQIFGELNKEKEIVYHTAKEVYETVNAIGEGMILNGFENKHIAIIATNSYRYVLTDLAIAGGVGVVTPIDKDASEELLATLLNRVDSEVAVVSTDVLKRVERAMQNCEKLKTLITIDKKIEGYLSLDEIIEQGKNVKEEKYRNKELDLDAPCEILLTSGTTGANKGVIMTQRNMTANIINCMDVIKGENKNNTSMSILPMHHATEINTHIMPRVASGRLTYINSSMKEMMTNIKIFKPYVITVVPMIANAFYKTIWSEAKKQGKEEILKKGIKLCKLLKKFNIDITHKLFKDLYVPFGGNLKQIVCGGAPLNPEVVNGLKDLGIYIINGFGITECGPLVSMNTDPYTEVYSIGQACPGLEVKIADADENGVGELCVKGTSVSKGYYKDEQGTKAVHDEDGFFHTGDLVRMDNKKRLFLAGRKKNLIVLANGKNVFPEELETQIQNSIKYVKDVVVFEGEFEMNGKTNQAISAMFNVEDDAKDVSKEKLLEDFRELNKTLPAHKRIGYLEMIEGEFEKNASRKIIRMEAVKKHNKNTGIVV